MEFSVLRKTIGGVYLLKGKEEAIAKPLPVFDAKGRIKVGKIIETICRVSEPYYLAVLEDGGKLVGKTITAKG